MAKQEKDYENEIIIAGKDITVYIYALILALQPHNYEKYGEIKIQTIEANLPKTEQIISLFKNLWVEETNRERKKIKVTPPNGRKYSIDVIEITVKKHPKLRR